MKKIAIFSLLFAFSAAFAAERGTVVRVNTAPKPVVVSARAASTQKVLLQPNTAKIATSSAKDSEDDPCKMSYWACMDAFCMSSNDNGGRCACSNDSIKLDKAYKEIVDSTNKAINQSSAATTSLEYGDQVNATTGEATQNSTTTECEDSDISCKIGAAKYSAAATLCEKKVTPECKSNFAFTKLQYSQNIRNDCNTYQAAIKDTQSKSNETIAAAQKELRDTAATQFATQNTLNESECLIEFKGCMNGVDVCGKNWERCTPENVADKEYMCQKTLDKCVVVKDSVLAGFIAEINPTLKSAALSNENNSRQSCLTNISDCIVKACQDNITGLGQTMDACLARPEMARSFCKVELDSCDSDGNLWVFVKQRLAGMRTDKCTQELKSCFTAETACGPDFSQCIGMDMDSVYKVCPIDKLVVCKQDNPNFSMSDLTGMIDGIMMNMDNKIQDLCIKLTDDKMLEVCGDAANCDTQFSKYNSSDFMGAADFGTVLISEGSEWINCKSKNPNDDCKDLAQTGTILSDDYIKAHPTSDPVELQRIKADLASASDKIDNVFNMIEQDQKISWCIGGRDLKQVGSKTQTTARMPTLTQSLRHIIALSALKHFAQSPVK